MILKNQNQVNSSSFSENEKILTKNKSEKGFKNEGLFNNNSTPYSLEEINNKEWIFLKKIFNLNYL